MSFITYFNQLYIPDDLQCADRKASIFKFFLPSQAWYDITYNVKIDPEDDCLHSDGTLAGVV